MLHPFSSRECMIYQRAKQELRECIQSQDAAAGEAALARCAAEKVVPDVLLYTMLMRCYAKQRNYPSARQVLTRMQAAGVQPTVVTYNTLLSCCGNGIQAQRLVQDMVVPPDVVTYNTLLSCYKHSPGSRRTMYGVVATMRAAGLKPDLVTYNTLLSHCAFEQDTVGTKLVLAEMRRHCLPPDDITHCILRRCGRARQSYSHESADFVSDGALAGS